MIKNELLYPIFLDCCSFVKDDFWKYIFEDLAYGRSPYGTYIKKGFLCCNYKNKEFSYKIQKDKDSQQVYNEVYDLLHNKYGLLSNIDIQNKKKYFELINQDEQDEQKNNWNSIKKKNIKNILIENFIIEKKSKYNLILKKCKILLSIIIIGFLFKTLSSENIRYEDGRIKDIDMFKFEQNDIIINTAIYDFEEINTEIVFDKCKKMSDNWNKYLVNLRKKY